MNVKILSLFTGIGAFEKALSKLNIPYEITNFCEIDTIISKIYSNIHNIDINKNLIDVSNISNYSQLTECDIMTYGFPCQSFSMAGKRLGFEDSRGILFFDAMKIAQKTQPYIMIAENVVGLINHEKGETFKTILNTLDSMEYNNYYKTLNAIDYGIPQNRKRVFIVSIKKNIDNKLFNFPKSQKLHYSWRNFIDMDHTNLQLAKPNKTPSRDRMQQQCKNITNELYCSTITTKQDRYPNAGIINYEDYYRFLTILEQWRLMGFDDNDFLKAKEITQSKIILEKSAGNSIVVNVLVELFKEIFKLYF